MSQHGAVGSNLLKPTMISPSQSTPAVPVGSSDLNQGPTTVPGTSATIGGAVPQKLPNQPNNTKKKKKPKNLYICTWNARTLSEESHLTNLMHEVKDMKWDVVGLSEVRRPGENLIETKEHHLLFHKGKESLKQSGIGFLINKNIKDKVHELYGISDRVASLTLKLSNKFDLKIIQVYAPTSTSSDEELETFYEEVTQALDHQKAQQTIIMGDFNAKIGEGNESCLGKFAKGSRNDRGDDLVNYCLTNDLQVANTFFQKKLSRKWTWRSPNFETLNEIDYIITSKISNVRNIEVINKVKGSDHRMVRGTLQIDLQMERKRLFHSKNKPTRINQLLKNEFQSDLEEKFQQIQTITDVEELNNHIVEVLTKTTENYKETQDQNINKKLSQSTLDLMKKRKELYVTSNKEKVEFAELNKLVSKKQREDIRKYNLTTIQQTIEQGKGFKSAKKKLCIGKTQMTALKEEDGSVTRNRDRIVERAKQFYEKLYSSDQDSNTIDDSEELNKLNSSLHPLPVPEIAADEIEHTIHQLKRGKAPGPDNITPDVLRDAGPSILKPLANLYTECLKQNKIPESWHSAIVILLHKKGDQQDLANYRPISLLSALYKLFTKILTNRIAKQLDDNQPREQAGFRSGYSTTDHLHAMHQLIEKTSEYNMPLCLAFVDYRKAFDSVEIPAVLEAIKSQGVEQAYVNMLNHIYQHASAFIRLHKDSDIFKLGKGVRQGDCISPKLFTACLENVFRKLNWEEKGIKIDGEMFTHLRFADDIVLASHDPNELQTMLKELNRESKKVGLEMNLSKTQVMFNELINDDPEIKIDQTPLKNVTSYTYLGQLITTLPNKEQEIKRRISLGWKAFGRASSIFKSKMPICLKRKVYNQCIIPTITYGCETWNLTKKLTLKLRSTQRAHERIMLGFKLKDRKRASWIREQTKLEDVVKTTKSLKWNWAGHVQRFQDNRWTKRTTEWIPRDQKRSIGRQRTRWRDELDRYEKNWRRMTQDRKKWREMRKAFAQQWDTNGC